MILALGDFFADRFLWGRVRVWCIVGKKLTSLLESGLGGLNCQP